jgi:hypothetical protein
MPRVELEAKIAASERVKMVNDIDREATVSGRDIFAL